MNKDILAMLRPEIRELHAYQSARTQVSGEDFIFLDANENPFESEWNRYPDPDQSATKKLLSQRFHIPEEELFLGNGSDEIIDLLIRAFCRPGIDRIAQFVPTYGVYQVMANIQGASCLNLPMTPDFQPDLRAFHLSDLSQVKLLFLCSPNNPSGNTINREILNSLIREFQGIVVLDEAYADFCIRPLPKGSLGPKVVRLYTLSKAAGLAGLRFGYAQASADIIGILNKIKLPYNLNNAVLKEVNQYLNQNELYPGKSVILSESRRLSRELSRLSCITKVYPSETNFILVQVDDAALRYQQLLEQKLVVRRRDSEPGCNNCLRISIGTPEQNQEVLQCFQSFSNQSSS